MLPQLPLPRMTPTAAPPRTLAKPPKAPLRGQAPSATPAPAQDANIKAVAMQQAQAAQPQRYQAPPAQAPRYQAPQQAPQAMAVQQQMPARAPMPAPQMAPDPRSQAIAAMKAQTGGDYPNPEWQPQPSFLKTTEPYAPAPVGAVVPATSAPAPVRYTAPAPSGGPVNVGIGAYNTTPVREAPDTSGSFVPKSPVEMNPRYVPGLPNEGAVDPTIGPDGQTIAPRPTVPASTTPLREEPITGLDPSGEFDWEKLADALGIGGLQDQVKETTAKGALAALTTPLSEYGFSPEEMKAQEDQIIRQAAEAKAKLAQQMAGRGLGGSGLEIAGLGNVDVGALSAITDLATENKALQIESRLNEIKTFLGAYGAQLDDETRKELAAEAADLQKEMFEYEKSSQAEADKHTALNNALAQVGADKWDPETLAWAYDQLDAGGSVQDILRALGISSTGGENGQTVYKQGADSGAPGIVGPTGQEGGVGANYAEPTEVPWGAMSSEQQSSAYEEYKTAALQSGQDPMSESDWNLWQYARDDYKGG